jgi:signal transduction histidine kinase
MNKISKFWKIIFIILYIIVVCFLIFENKQISLSYNLPSFIISGIILISILFICYKYIISIMREDELEEEIVSIVNHTFRTPLTSMVWYIKELEKNIPQNEKLIYLQNLNNRANKLLSIIDVLVGIKDVENTSGYYFEAISIREIVEKSIKKYREKINKKNITFQVSTFKDIPLLTMDLKKISFVIDTIIENAITYTKQDGKILIDCISGSKKLTLYISDTGIGLGLMDKIMLFSKFYRNHKAKLMNTDGMGLRLYLSKQIIKRHGGKIYAKSNGSNEGTTFFIELPFRK